MTKGVLGSMTISTIPSLTTPSHLGDQLTPLQKAHLIDLLLKNGIPGYDPNGPFCLPESVDQYWNALMQEPLSWASAFAADLAWTQGD